MFIQRVPSVFMPMPDEPTFGDDIATSGRMTARQPPGPLYSARIACTSSRRAGTTKRRKIREDEMSRISMAESGAVLLTMDEVKF
jgi:hypothetical protein